MYCKVKIEPLEKMKKNHTEINELLVQLGRSEKQNLNTDLVQHRISEILRTICIEGVRTFNSCSGPDIEIIEEELAINVDFKTKKISLTIRFLYQGFEPGRKPMGILVPVLLVEIGLRLSDIVDKLLVSKDIPFRVDSAQIPTSYYDEDIMRDLKAYLA